MKTNPITVHELGSSSLVEDLADAVEHDTGARVYEACWDGRVSFYEVGAAPGESYIEARLPGGSVWRIRCTGEEGFTVDLDNEEWSAHTTRTPRGETNP